jgi:chromosome segregation ATPase
VEKHCETIIEYKLSNKLSKLMKRIYELERDLREVRLSLETANPSDKGLWQERAEKAEAENDDLRHRLELVKEQLNFIENETMDAAEEMTRLKDENEKLRRQLEFSEDKLGSFGITLDAAMAGR